MKKIIIILVCGFLAIAGILVINDKRFENSIESKEFLLINEDFSKVLKCEFFDSNNIEEITFDGLEADEYYSICSDNDNAIWVAALHNGENILAKTVDYKVVHKINLDFMPRNIAYYNNKIIASEVDGKIYSVDPSTGKTDLLTSLSYSIETADYCPGGFSTDGTYLCWIDDNTITVTSPHSTRKFPFEYSNMRTLTYGGFHGNDFFFHQGDLEEGYYLCSMNVHTGEIKTIRYYERWFLYDGFFVNGKQVVVYYDSEKWTEEIYLRDVETGKEKLAFKPDGLCGTFPEFSPATVVIL